MASDAPKKQDINLLLIRVMKGLLFCIFFEERAALGKVAHETV